MEKNNVVSGTALFAGIAPDLIPGLLTCIGAKEVSFLKGSRLIEEGEKTDRFGIMLTGRGRTVKTDATGRVILIALLSPGSEIGVLLSASPGYESPVTVLAEEASTVLMIPYDRLMARCPQNCPQHERLVRNYVSIVAQKGLLLHERIDCLLRPSVRGKIMAYLSRVSGEQGSDTILLPLDRSAMAEYLNVDRSALSRELSRMKKDGFIDYHKNCFRLLAQKR